MSRRSVLCGPSILSVACLALACSGGGPRRLAFGMPAEARTQAVLVGELCASGEPCQCRDLAAPGTGGVSHPDEAPTEASPGASTEAPTDPTADASTSDAVPAPEARRAPSARRIELRLRSSHALWLRLGPWTFAKDRERSEACFTIDIPAGDAGSYEAELRAANRDGVSVGLELYELGAAAGTWYRTLSWSCGAPGACTFEALDEQKQELAKASAEGRLWDPCGSLKITGLVWDSRAAPDHLHPGELTLAFSLRTTDRVPERPAGDPSCRW